MIGILRTSIQQKTRDMQKIFTLLIMASLALFSASCQKDEDDKSNKDEKDIRNKYVGEWNFTTDLSSFSMGDNSSSFDVVQYSGTITKGNSSQELIVRYLEDSKVAVTLEIDESLDISQAYSSAWRSWWRFFSLHYWGKKIM